MKHKVLILALISMISILTFGCHQKTKCKEGLNLLPMYGNVQKCEEQIKSDIEFLELSKADEPDRFKAGLKMMDTGWYHLHKGDYETAMKRINQAWLLDSTNIAIYESFVVILDLSLKTDDALKMLDYTLNKVNVRENPQEPSQMNPSNETFIEFIISNTAFAYKKTKDTTVAKHLHSKIESLKISESDKEKMKNKLESDIPNLLLL